MGGKVTMKSDEAWQAESDAETLARAAEIQADKKRLKKAAKAAKSMVSDAQIRAKAMKRIAKKAIPKNAPAKKSTIKKSPSKRGRKK